MLGTVFKLRETRKCQTRRQCLFGYYLAVALHRKCEAYITDFEMNQFSNHVLGISRIIVQSEGMLRIHIYIYICTQFASRLSLYVVRSENYHLANVPPLTNIFVNVKFLEAVQISLPYLRLMLLFCSINFQEISSVIKFSCLFLLFFPVSQFVFQLFYRQKNYSISFFQFSVIILCK